MSVNLHSLIPESTETDWMPSASQETLLKRARFLRAIREFFYVRDVMEVDTPVLTQAPVTDPHIESMQIITASENNNLYLGTSPEFYMKRLMAAGSGSIYQLGKVFRNDEQGKLHSPEFTMLEWYRAEFDHHALMHEVDELMQYLLQTEKADRMTYGAAFEQYAGLNPFTATIKQLQDCANTSGINLVSNKMERDDWLALLLTHLIEPRLGKLRPVFIYDFPASQAALARVHREGEYEVAERFELYYHGIELANGYYELTDSQEQRRRFEQDRETRRQSGKPVFDYDEAVLAALNAGLPDCAGVAAG
ncbi:MAG: EF-P lysine aminoacylase EpmA, partial [Gammaproteobacteria bacterium]|nr:EF-P lysine aminoacylase EpmA [Gammaproteobacteria bacterium]